jgi:hypothetical protein
MITTDNRVGLNLKEIALMLGVSTATPSTWKKVWTPDSDHPFPSPTAKLALWIKRRNDTMGWSRPFLCYDRDEIILWHDGLREAQRERRSASMRESWRSRPGMPVHPDRALVEIRELRAEVNGLKVLVNRGPVNEEPF